MSKVTEYLASIKPPPQATISTNQDRKVSVQVMTDGKLLIQSGLDYPSAWIYLTPDAALKLAMWILDTYGEMP